MKPCYVRGALALAVLLGGAVAGYAEAVRNGNELALEYATADKAGKKAKQAAATGKLFTFRYLKIKEMTLAPNEVRMTTIEPSSDMEVVLVARQKKSLELAATATTNDCVAINGRVIDLGRQATNRMIVDPAIIRFKDRASPKPGEEALHDVDKTAH
jgi:hypothetical protein